MKLTTISYYLILLSILTLPLYFLTAIHRDEAIFLRISSGLTQGYLPYNDYFDNKPPGIYFLMAPLIALTGNTILGPRLLLLTINLTTAYLIYLISQQLNPKQPKLTHTIPALLSLILTPIFHGQYTLTEPPMILLLTASTYFLFKSLNHPNLTQKYLPLAGFFSGLALIFKQVAILNILITFIIILAHPNKSKTKIPNTILYLLPCTIPLVLLIIYLISQNLILEAYAQIINAIIFDYPSTPIFFNLKQLPLLLPPLLPFLAAAINNFTNSDEPPKFPTLNRYLALSLIPGFLIFYRPYHHYLIQILPFIILYTTPTIIKSRWMTLILLSLLTFSIIHFNYYIYTTDYPWKQNQFLSASRSTNCIGIDDQLAYLRACPPPNKY